jgi:bifunctional DNA-binding transcriptional regulator/antitoxin component of YhaV-PrlF toxin-antitoxin module
MAQAAAGEASAVVVPATAHLTLPAEVRQRLGFDGETEFDVEVTEHGSVTLRPVVVIPRDDAWAYTAKHLAQVAKALADIREGRVRRLSDADLAAYD